MAQEKINIETIGERSWDIKDLVNNMRRLVTVWSWGASDWAVYKDLVLKFRVRGHHHKGYVYITLGWDDTFNVYIVSTQGNIKKTHKGVYVDELINVIDKDVEYIDAYAK